jgi:hypothetical protein
MQALEDRQSSPTHTSHPCCTLRASYSPVGRPNPGMQVVCRVQRLTPLAPLPPAQVGKEPKELLSLWLHENLRVFSDRLVSRDDVAWFQTTLSAVMKDKCVAPLCSHPCIVVAFERRIWKAATSNADSKQQQDWFLRCLQGGRSGTKP